MKKKKKIISANQFNWEIHSIIKVTNAAEIKSMKKNIYIPKLYRRRKSKSIRRNKIYLQKYITKINNANKKLTKYQGGKQYIEYI